MNEIKVLMEMLDTNKWLLEHAQLDEFIEKYKMQINVLEKSIKTLELMPEKDAKIEQQQQIISILMARLKETSDAVYDIDPDGVYDDLVEKNEAIISEVERLKQENENLRELACERCKLTKNEFACKLKDYSCIAYK